MALGVDGFRVGCWTSDDGLSGCTVVLAPAGALGAVAVRGAAPGTREAAALGPNGKLTTCHAVVLAGGSAYGLAAADGVVDWLEERGVGYEVPIGLVPIVGAAIVLDASVGRRESRPGPAAGRAACDAAGDGDPAEGGVGVGAGCTVAKVGGIEHGWRSGQGIAVRRSGGVTVGAIVANNAVGEVIADDGSWLARSRAPEDVVRYPESWRTVVPDRDEHGRLIEPSAGPAGATVIGCIVTDAILTKAEAVRVADIAHGGTMRAVRPAHTSMDGDALFCLAAQRVESHVDLVAHLATEAVAEAVRRGTLAATSRDGLPGLADQPPGNA